MELRTAIILCGGKGTRLGSIGKKIPKTLIKIQGYPIIWYIINILKKNNFNHFILPVGHKGNLIKKYINNHKKFKKDNIDVVPTGENSSISKRIYKVKKIIKSEIFLLLNGDAIFDANLDKIYKQHKSKKIDVSFITCSTEADFGTVGIKNDKIIDFKRGISFNTVKSNNNKNYFGLVYSGMAIMKKKILKENFVNKSNFEKEFYPKIIKKYKCKSFDLDGTWHAMDNLKDINIINKKKENINMYKKIKKIIVKVNNDR
jgi:glucose-1-phosphate cytidylyltransferase